MYLSWIQLLLSTHLFSFPYFNIQLLLYRSHVLQFFPYHLLLLLIGDSWLNFHCTAFPWHLFRQNSEEALTEINRTKTRFRASAKLSIAPTHGPVAISVLSSPYFVPAPVPKSKGRPHLLHRGGRSRATKASAGPVVQGTFIEEKKTPLPPAQNYRNHRSKQLWRNECDIQPLKIKGDLTKTVFNCARFSLR